MRKKFSNSVSFAILLLSVMSIYQSAGAALAPGLLSDFEDGNTQGWEPPKANTTNVAGGPTGSTRALQISSAPRLAAHNTGISGVIDPAVAAIEIDMMRISTDAPLEMRLLLMGPGSGNRWTSTNSQLLPGDGVWRTYNFSILEADLTRVLGGSDYANLTASLNRISIRHDAGGPSAQGTAVPTDADPFFIDNVTAVSAIPVPAAVWLFGTALLGLFGFNKLRFPARALD